MKLKSSFKNTVFYVKTIPVSSTFILKNLILYSSGCNYKSTRPEKKHQLFKDTYKPHHLYLHNILGTLSSSDIKITG